MLRGVEELANAVQVTMGPKVNSILRYQTYVKILEIVANFS